MVWRFSTSIFFKIIDLHFFQFVAGLLEFVRGETKGTVIFGSYGAFWLTIAFITILPSTSVTPAVDPGTLALFFFWWGLLTTGFYLGLLLKGIPIHVLFIGLSSTFFLLAIADLLAQVA